MMNEVTFSVCTSPTTKARTVRHCFNTFPACLILSSTSARQLFLLLPLAPAPLHRSRQLSAPAIAKLFLLAANHTHSQCLIVASSPKHGSSACSRRPRPQNSNDRVGANIAVRIHITIRLPTDRRRLTSAPTGSHGSSAM